MNTLQQVWLWMQANPVVAIAIAVYVIANLAPRPHPKELSGWKATFWAVVDGLCLLTAAKVPGRLKWLLANSPPLEPAPAPESEKKAVINNAKAEVESPATDEDDKGEEAKT